ncbi:MAG: metalloregulator ArsR/SmtB family transcription factor [Myxococcota bacterium]|nr:metalloregulator ArsR/SmtB family transcription factor [Myxococcota bacterium]
MARTRRASGRIRETPSPELLDLMAARFRALGDPSRLRLLHVLMDGERAVGELERATGLGQASVSRHLAVLRREGLVARRAEGNRALYRIADPTVRRLCALVCGGLEERFADGLEAVQGAGI